MPNMIIAVTGKAGSGKDTICDYLNKEHDFEKFALADPIKRIVKDVFVLNDDEVYDRVKRELPMEDWKGFSVRQLLQLIGTELFRNNIDSDIWVKSLWKRMEKTHKNCCVSDVRFPNELEYLQNKVGPTMFYTIKIVRNGCDGSVGVANHESEKYNLDADVVIENNGTIDDLYYNVDCIMQQFS